MSTLILSIIVLFFLFPAIMGCIVHYLDLGNYLKLMRLRRKIRSTNVLVLMVWGAIAVIYLLAAAKYFLQEDVKNIALFASAILLLCSFYWVFTEFPVIQWGKKYDAILVALVALISYIVSTLSLGYIDGLVISWTGYGVSEFPVSSAAMNIMVIPAFWTIVFWFVMTAITLFFVIRLLFLTISFMLVDYLPGRGFLRFITLGKFFGNKSHERVRNLTVSGTICCALYISYLSLPRVTLGYLGGEKFTEHLKSVFIMMSYHSDARLCQNVDGEELKIALLSRDRISVFKQGDTPEFSRGVCEFEQSPYITE
ncbi:hypothetical protein [Vibrio brasiliensis]|uniref:hypothetical protein n=1 Tax=Vibrio brasiliensis TaxID=170652 RepID=UPI001EFCAE41|nr:hypothetical protein [Vibrio brasiliensis]MCG9724497.1 hypothetical protein [Vibrio brasiliensis]